MAKPISSPGAKPSHYDIRIEPDLKRETFEGIVCIELKAAEAMTSITLNAHGLDIQSTALHDVDGISIKISGSKIDEKLQTFTITLADPICGKKTLVLRQSFTGILSKFGTGFHISASSLMASTHMEPNFARTVFPCFDDPSLKATFSVTLVASNDLTCLGNMPVKLETQISSNSTKKAVEFEKTPVMSTYLVAFAVGKLNMIESEDFRIPIRAYAPQDCEMGHCCYALDTARRVLNILEELFQTKYALPKLDLLAVPGSVGGMENWGLVTVSTSVLVMNPDGTADERINSAQVIAHELAHQWLGNLVTMSSWDNYWLKEGLAEWAELEVWEKLPGCWEPSQEFVAEGLQWALDVDSKRFGHPIEVAIDGSTVTKPFFDEITYNKGCAVLRMLANHLGKDVFLRGIQRYLKLYSYENTQSDDLWEALSQVSGMDVGDFMKPWTTISGFPVIDVEEDERAGTITITQNRFQTLKTEETNQNNTIYTVFLNIVSTTGIIREKLKEKTMTIKVPLEFYKLNANQTGFYRVAYTTTRLRRLGEDICKGYLSVEDRIGIVSDTAALTLVGHTNLRTSDLFSLLQNFEDEQSFFVWRIIISTLNQLQKPLLFEDDEIKDAYTRFCKHLVKKCLYRKGTFSEYDDMNELRFKALMFGNAAGDEKVMVAAQVMFDRFICSHASTINPNIRATVFEIVLRNGGKKEYCKLKNKLKTASCAERADILSSLGYSQHPACIKKTLKIAMSADSISRSEISITLKSLATHKRGISALWKFITSGIWMKNPKLSLEKIVPIGGYVLEAFTTMEQCGDARAFLGNMDMSAFEANLEQAFDAIEVRANWIERDREDVMGWLDRNGYGKRPTCSKGSMSGSFRGFWKMARKVI